MAIFDGPTHEFEDTREDYGEERVIAIGECALGVLVVVYTMRGDVCRIISARGATSYEARRYREG